MREGGASRVSRRGVQAARALSWCKGSRDEGGGGRRGDEEGWREMRAGAPTSASIWAKAFASSALKRQICVFIALRMSSFTWRGDMGGGNRGANGGVNRWGWRCEASSFTSSLWLVSSQKTIWTIVWSAGSASNPSDMSEPRDLVERSGAERRECRCEGEEGGGV